MRCSIRKVTPMIAKEWLATNDGNQRKIISLKVEQYARDMGNGAWKENGESIIFSRDNKLIDGQHRLRAIAMSGVTIDVVVVTDVDPESFASIDTGKSRTGGNIMEIHQKKNSALLASLLRLIAGYKDYGLFPGQQGAYLSKVVTNDRLVAAMNSEPLSDEICSIVNSMRDATRIIPPSLLSFLMWIVGGTNRDTVISFMDMLGSGENLHKLHPVLALRKKILEGKVHTAYSPVAKWSFLVRSWNAFVAGENIAYIRWSSGEAIPNIVIP